MIQSCIVFPSNFDLQLQFLRTNALKFQNIKSKIQ